MEQDPCRHDVPRRTARVRLHRHVRHRRPARAVPAGHPDRRGLLGARGLRTRSTSMSRSARPWTSRRSSSCWCCRPRPETPPRDASCHRDRRDRHHCGAPAVDRVLRSFACSAFVRSSSFWSTIVIAMLEGPAEGAVVGFVCGLTQDMLLNQPKGITALTLTLLGTRSAWRASTSCPLAAGARRSSSRSPPRWGWRSTRSCRSCWDSSRRRSTYAVKVALLAALYNAVLTPILYPLLRRIVEGSRPRRVVRF